MLKRIKRNLYSVFYAPINVVVFHSVSDVFDGTVCRRTDWHSTESFKMYVESCKRNGEFISLTQAFDKLTSNVCRRKKYFVLTCDDGFASVNSILPYCEKQEIPITLFINPKYLDGISVRQGYTESPRYLSMDDLLQIRSRHVTIGMHGYEHEDATKMTKQEFEESVSKCEDILSSHPRYIPFFAYPWGRWSNQTQEVLSQRKIIPVFSNGQTNFKYCNGINRTVLPQTTPTE